MSSVKLPSGRFRYAKIMGNGPKNRDVKIQSPDIEGLRDFAGRTGRQDPPAFVGRKDIIEKLAEDLRYRREAWRKQEKDAWEGATWLFQGAPGAGKTALLRRLKELAVSDEEKKGTALARVLRSSLFGRQASRYGGVQALLINEDSVFYSLDALKGKIAKVIDPKAGEEMEEALTTEESFNLRLYQHKRSSTRFQKSWDQFVEEVGKNPGKYPPLLLMFDEAQALADEAGESLRWLHKGTHGLPIVPVFGGLAWTRMRFKSLELSRLDIDRVHTLELLSTNECREAARKFLDKYRVIGVTRAREKWAEMIARECMGWPQHLHVGLQGLAEALVQSKGYLEKANKKVVIEGGDSRRNAYYQDRLDSDSLKSKRYLVASAVARMPEGAKMAADDLADIVAGIHSETVAAKNPSRLRLPDGYSPAKFVRSMVYAGILHEDGDGYLSVPIPSFRDFLKERYSPPDRDAAPGTENPPSPAP